MPKEIPNISREHEQYAEKALADKIRSWTLQSVHLLDEMLWAGRSALTVLPRKDGDKIGWKSGYPLRLRANPGKTEEVNAIKEGANIKITGRPCHATDKDGDHWWYPVEVSGWDLRDPNSAKTWWVSAEFIQAELPASPVLVSPPVEGVWKETKDDANSDPWKDTWRAPDEAVKIRKNHPSGRAPDEAMREKKRDSTGRAPDDAVRERRAFPWRAPDDNRKNRNPSRPTILPLPPKPSGSPDRLTVPRGSSGIPGAPTPPRGPSGAPSSLNIPQKNSGPTQPLNTPKSPSGKPEPLSIPERNSGKPLPPTPPTGPSGTPEALKVVWNSSGLPQWLDIPGGNSGPAQPLKTPTGPSGSLEPLSPPSDPSPAPEKIPAPSNSKEPILSSTNKLPPEIPLTLDEKNFVGFNEVLSKLVPKVAERNKIIRFIRSNPDLALKEIRLSEVGGTPRNAPLIPKDSEGKLNENVSFKDGKAMISTMVESDSIGIYLEWWVNETPALVIKTRDGSTEIYSIFR